MDKLNFKKSIVVLFHAFVVWALCGSTIAIGRTFMTMNQTLLIHATLAPVFAALVSLFYYKKFYYTTPVKTALCFLLFVFVLDAGLVAPVFEKSYAMFKSITGTWIPFMLIFLSAYITGLIVKRVKKTDKAIDYFRNSFNCSQSVFTVFGKDYGLSENDCLKIGCAFGAGMGRQQLTCGAVTGALLALGLKYGKAYGDSEDKKRETYMKTREFFTEFIRINGSSSCRELLNGLDINDADDYQKIIDQNLFVTHCEKYVTDAVEIAGEMID
jgi:C_GCAxxG_C_C family probable redox protein